MNCHFSILLKNFRRYYCHIFHLTFILSLLFLLESPVLAEDYFTGDGRKDLKIQVENPELHNIGDESAWLPEFVVNTISDAIAKYSNIEIADTHNAQKIAATQRRDESANFSEDEIVEAGNFTVARNVLLVSITGKNTSYALSVRINDKEKNVSIAAHNKPNCSYEDLESGKALAEAVADLLSQLQVSLTDEGKKSLLEVGTASGMASISAQKLVAQGTVAQQKGSNIEALSYFIQAATSDDSLERALKAMSSGSQVIAAGDFGTQARNLIQRRNDFRELIATTKSYFEKNIPYYIVYDPDLQMGKINYEKETFDMSVKVAVVKDIEKEKVYKNILQAYASESDSKNWGLDYELRSIFPDVNYYVTLQLQDKNGKTLGSTEKNISMNSSLSNFARWGNYTITISANADTSNIVFSVPKVVYGNRNEEKNLSVSKITVSDYVNKVLVKSFAFEEVVQGISVFILPNYDSKSDCNRFLKEFGFGTAEKISEKIAQGTPLKLDELVYSKKEYDILNRVRSSQRTANGAWVVNQNVFYANGNYTAYPRSKVAYAKNLGYYLPIEFVKIPGSDYKFIKKTEELEYALSLFDARFSNSRYEYYEETTILFNDSRNKSRSVYAYEISNKNIVEQIANTAPFPLRAVLKSNFDHTYVSPSNGTQRVGSKNYPLRDFSAYIEANPENQSKLLALYTIDTAVVIKGMLPKMQSFTAQYDISKDRASEKLLAATIESVAAEKWNYDFGGTNIDSSAKFELVINAINELLGYEPYLLNANGTYAHTLSEVVQRNYSTDGFMLPRESDYAECPEKLKKSIDKAAKKNAGKYFFLMKKKAEK